MHMHSTTFVFFFQIHIWATSKDIPVSYLPVFISTIGWVDHFRSPSARIARFLPRVQGVLYHSLQHLCLILLQSLWNTAHFCRWCCDTASPSSWFLAVSTKPSLAMAAEHLPCPPEATSLPKYAECPSPNKAQFWGAQSCQTGCSGAGDLLSTLQTSGPGLWHRMKLDSPPPTATRRKPRPPQLH